MPRPRSSDKVPPKRRGRPPGSGKKPISTSQAKPAAVTKKPTKPAKPTKPTRQGRRRAPQQRDPQLESEDELSILDNNVEQERRGTKRKVAADADHLASSQSKTHKKKYKLLQYTTKKVSEAEIDTWSPIPQSVLEQITTVLRDAKNETANTQQDERRTIAAHNALNPLMRKMVRRMADSRIPRQAKDVHLNIDKLTERNAIVARDLTTARHAKQLLIEQTEKIERLLQKEQASLDDMKASAKSWRDEWKHQEKRGRLHPLLLEEADVTEHNDSADEIALKPAAKLHGAFAEEPDDDLAVVLDQLQRSLESLQSNHTQVEGIDEAMLDARTALDEVLFRHTSAQQYAAL